LHFNDKANYLLSDILIFKLFKKFCKRQIFHLAIFLEERLHLLGLRSLITTNELYLLALNKYKHRISLR